MTTIALLPFVQALQREGGRVYTVGGTVRDELLGHPRKDLDLLVTGLPQPLLIRCLQSYGRVQLTGRVFGVIKFLPRQWAGPPIDVALPRTEVSTGVGHRDFEVTFDHTLPIDVDLGRRDFTINAMATDLADGRLMDPFGGAQDLTQRLLRQVSDAAFPEDPLRMLRGVQLATRLGLQVESGTRQAMCDHAATIATVAPERIAEELRKLFQAQEPSCGFRLMHEVGLLRHVLPEIDGLPGVSIPAPQCGPDTSPPGQNSDALTRTLRRLDMVQQCSLLPHQGDLQLLLAALFQDCGRSPIVPLATPQDYARIAATRAEQALERLRMTTIGAHTKLITTIIVHSAFPLLPLLSDTGLRHFAHSVGVQEALLVFDLRLADCLGHTPDGGFATLKALGQRLRMAVAQRVPLTLKDLAINGHDLQQLGIAPGPHLGEILQALLHRVLDNPPCNTRDDLLHMVRTDLSLPNRANSPSVTS